MVQRLEEWAGLRLEWGSGANAAGELLDPSRAEVFGDRAQEAQAGQ